MNALISLRAWEDEDDDDLDPAGICLSIDARTSIRLTGGSIGIALIDFVI
jgi:hypothetical protein